MPTPLNPSFQALGIVMSLSKYFRNGDMGHHYEPGSTLSKGHGSSMWPWSWYSGVGGFALCFVGQVRWKKCYHGTLENPFLLIAGEVSKIPFIHKSSWDTLGSVLLLPKGNSVLKSYSSARLYFFLLLGCISKVITFGLLPSNNLWLQRIMTS